MHFESDEILVTIVIGTALIVFFGGVIFFLFFLFQKKKLRYIREKQTLQVQFEQELLQTQIEIQEQTLKTISQEIHDNVGQVLSLAKLNLNTVGPITDERTHAKIESTKELVSKAINDLRDLSRSLHGEKIGEIGLQDAIANELKILQNIGQFETDLTISRQPYKTGPAKRNGTVPHCAGSVCTTQLNMPMQAM